MRAARFAPDPQKYINQYHDILLTDHPDEIEHAIFAISEIYELKNEIQRPDYNDLHPENEIQRTNYTELHPELEVFLSGAGEYDPVSIETLFTWLKRAGFTKDQVEMWVGLESDGFISPAEQLQERSMRVILNQVFE